MLEELNAIKKIGQTPKSLPSAEDRTAERYRTHFDARVANTEYENLAKHVLWQNQAEQLTAVRHATQMEERQKRATEILADAKAKQWQHIAFGALLGICISMLTKR